MQGFEQTIKKVTISGNNIGAAPAQEAEAAASATSFFDKLIYDTPVANDHLYHDLEKRYGSVFAQWIVDNLP